MSIKKIFCPLKMSYNSRNVRAVTENFYCTSIPMLSKGACQKYCESSKNWGCYEQKETTYFKGAFF